MLLILSTFKAHGKQDRHKWKGLMLGCFKKGCSFWSHCIRLHAKRGEDIFWWYEYVLSQAPTKYILRQFSNMKGYTRPTLRTCFPMGSGLVTVVLKNPSHSSRPYNPAQWLWRLPVCGKHHGIRVLNWRSIGSQARPLAQLQTPRLWPLDPFPFRLSGYG